MRIDVKRHTCASLGIFLQIPLHQDGARNRAAGFENDVLHFQLADIARVSHSNGWDGIVHVRPDVRCIDHDHGPSFTHDPNVHRNLERVGDDVGAVVEVGHLVPVHRVEELLQTRSVIRDAVAVASKRLRGHKLVDRPIIVRRLSTVEDLARARVAEASWE
jgi:hypothetical protein